MFAAYDVESNWILQGHATNRDEFYGYDNLNRLTALDRGSLNTGNTAISGTPVKEEDWTLDQLGNWSGYGTKASGTADLTLTRTHNAANEISGISESGGSPVWIDPTQDKAGNMTTMPKPDAPTTTLTATYDGWNRMRTAVIDSQTQTYSYDGLGRRTRSVASPDDATGPQLLLQKTHAIPFAPPHDGGSYENFGMDVPPHADSRAGLGQVPERVVRDGGCVARACVRDAGDHAGGNR